MIIFWRLVLGHFIADFTLQTNRIASWKRHSRWGMLVHVLCHPIAYIVLTFPYLNLPWLTIAGISLNGWACIALISLLHWAEDEWRVWAVSRGVPDNTVFLAWDQFFHLIILWLFAARVPGMPSEKWVFALLGVVILAHTTSVLIYFLERDTGIDSTVLEKGKYQFMAERLLGAALFALLPGYSIAVAFAFLGWRVWHYQSAKKRDRTLLHLTVGYGMMVGVGLSLRLLH